jgi:hypothetical protein
VISAATALVASITGPVIALHLGRAQIKASVLSANSARVGILRHRRQAFARAHRGADRDSGSAGSGLSDADARQIRAALDVGHGVIATVECREFTPDGELRHPVIRA